MSRRQEQQGKRKANARGNSTAMRCDNLEQLSHLVLTRKRNQTIDFLVGGKIVGVVEISEIRTNCVRVNMLVNKGIKVLRGELRLRIEDATAAATAVAEKNLEKVSCGEDKAA